MTDDTIRLLDAVGLFLPDDIEERLRNGELLLLRRDVVEEFLRLGKEERPRAVERIASRLLGRPLE